MWGRGYTTSETLDLQRSSTLSSFPLRRLLLKPCSLVRDANYSSLISSTFTCHSRATCTHCSRHDQTVLGCCLFVFFFFSNPVIVLPCFLEDTRLCVVDCFENYLLRTAGYRNNAEKPQVFLSYVSLTSLSVEIRLVGGLNQCFPQQEQAPLCSRLTVYLQPQRAQLLLMAFPSGACSSVSFASAVRGGETSK